MPGPSHRPVSRPGAGGVLPPSNPRPPALINSGAAGQHAYDTGSASAPPRQYLPETSTSLHASNQTHPTRVSPQVTLFAQGSRSLVLNTGLAFTPSLAVPSQSDAIHLCNCTGDYWLAWCNLAWEHYNAAINSHLPLIRLPCTCPPRLLNSVVPKCCPKAAEHLRTLVRYP